MHTILGANGVIARELSRALTPFSPIIRQVSRNPRRGHPTDEVVTADLLDGAATARAVSGSDVLCDYRFDSSKTESAFDLKATSYRQGITESLAWETRRHGEQHVRERA